MGVLEVQKLEIMKDALERAEEWFRKFRFNSDDFEDPKEILRYIENALSFPRERKRIW